MEMPHPERGRARSPRRGNALPPRVFSAASEGLLGRLRARLLDRRPVPAWKV